ncbi:MAG: PAS domain S-box protein [Sulfurimonas sp.]
MKQEVKSKKKIHLLILVFILIGILSVGDKFFEHFIIKEMNSTTTAMFEYPLKVTNAALTVNVNLYKMHRDMKDIVLSLSQKEIIELIKEVNKHEQHVYENLDVIEKNILGEEGRTLQKETKQLFESWKPIRDEVITLMEANQTRKAIDITQGRGANQVRNLEASTLHLYEYAQNKAIYFKNKSVSSFEELKIISFSISILFLFIFASIGFYVINRIAKFIYKNEHLRGVLSVIRDVNQLIVREKDKRKLLEESCNILASKHVYGNAWIVILDRDKKIDYFVNTDTSENATLFKQKIESGWLPLCLKKVSQTDQTYSTIESTKDSCQVCPLMDLYDSKSAFTIKLIHNEIIYGYLTLSVNNKYIADNDELALLDEVAGDIAYALYNLDIENNLKKSEKRYHSLFSGSHAIELIINTKDGRIVDCNQTALEYYGYTYEQMTNMLISEINILPPTEIMHQMQRAKDGQCYTFNFKHKLANGKIRDVEVYSGPIELDEDIVLYSIIFDVTEKKEALETIVYLKELYGNIINSVDNILFVKDLNGIYLTCNEAFERFIGKPKDEIIGKSDYDLVDKELADFFREHDKKTLLENKSMSNFEWVTYPNGDKVYLLTVKAPLVDSEGNVLGVVGNSVDLTKQNQAENALLASEESFRAVFNQSPLGIAVIDSYTGYIYKVNQSYADIIGRTIDEIPGIDWVSITHPDDIQKDLDNMARLNAGEINDYKMNKRYIHSDGSILWINMTISPLREQDGSHKRHLCMIEDITEKRIALKLLEDKKKELETIFDETPTPMAIHNEDGDILMINKVWEELTGYTHDEIDSISKWTSKVALNGNKSRKEHIKSLYNITERVEEGEFEITAKNGEKIIWIFYSAPLGIIDGKRTIISSAMDITELKKKDEMLISQSRLAAMGEMIGMIAHQWRQPIAGIAMDANNMLLDIALNEFDINSAEKYSISIIDQTEHLSKTIDDFRNFFKPDKTLTTVTLKDIIEETHAIVKDSLKNNSIEFKSSYDSDTEVKAYPRELMQVFVNIINNAKDSLVANKREDAVITVKVYDDEEYVNTEVCDNGVGIDIEILPKIFDPYFTTKDEKTGTGLGLYMSKMIIEEHLKGKIEVSSEDKGACFRVRLLKLKDELI